MIYELFLYVVVMFFIVKENFIKIEWNFKKLKCFCIFIKISVVLVAQTVSQGSYTQYWIIYVDLSILYLDEVMSYQSPVKVITCVHGKDKE